jgi:hypothetical protein
MAKSTTKPTATPKPMVRTAEGLRNILFEEIDLLRNNKGDRRRALTIASLAAQVINTAKVEIEYQRHLATLARDGSQPEVQSSLGSLRLGSDATV